jgi:hypothetical protein
MLWRDKFDGIEFERTKCGLKGELQEVIRNGRNPE